MLILGGCMFCAVGLAEPLPANLVVNGDFSNALEGKSSAWTVSGDAKAVDQKLSIVRQPDGRVFAKLECTRFEKPGPAAHAMIAQVGKVQLRKGQSYEFSCRMRQDGLAGRGVSVAVQDTRGWTNCGLSAQFSVGEVWREYRRVFVAKQDVSESSRLQIWFAETGTLCLADVRIAEFAAEVELTRVVPPGESRNLLPNGSFELGASGWSSLGVGVGWGDLIRLHGRVEHGGAAQGNSFLRVPMGAGRTPELAFDYYEPVVRTELRPTAANLGWVRVEPGSAYTLSCFLRASRPGVPAVLGIRTRDAVGSARSQEKAVTLTAEWTRYELSCKPRQAYVFVYAGPNLAADECVDVDVDGVQFEKAGLASEFVPRAEIEWSIETSASGGIFGEGQAPALSVRATNSSGSAREVVIHLAATDFEDRPVVLPEVRLAVAAGGVAEQTAPLPLDWRGFYRIAASSETAGRAGSGEVRVAMVPAPPRDSVCGINHAFASRELMPLAAKAGVTWYRDWSLKMQHIEPQKGQFRWELADEQIDRVLREGTQVLPLMPPFPSADWCSEAPDGLSTEGYPGNRIRTAFGPKDPADLIGFIERAVTRYRDRIHVWEFLNEPVYTNYALPSDPANKYGGRKYSAADYVSLLAKAAAAMRRADPEGQVMGGIAGWPRHLTQEVIDAGILQHIDLLNLHMYPGQRVPEAFFADMDWLLERMDRGGGRKPIWVTEFSYYGADDLPRKPFLPNPGSWSEERMLDSERQCADYTLRFFLIMLSRNVERIFIHSGASGRVNEPNFECALFADGGAPRKLFAALAVLNDLLGARPRFAGQVNCDKHGYGLAFETGARCVLAFWQTEEQPGLPLRYNGTREGAKWLDAMGRRLPEAPRLSSSPVYLVGEKGRAAEMLSNVVLGL